MRRLSEHDDLEMLAFVSESKDFDDVPPFPPRLFARLQELIASDGVAYSELDPVHERSILQDVHRCDAHTLADAGHGPRAFPARRGTRL